MGNCNRTRAQPIDSVVQETDTYQEALRRWEDERETGSEYTEEEICELASRVLEFKPSHYSKRTHGCNFWNLDNHAFVSNRRLCRWIKREYEDYFNESDRQKLVAFLFYSPPTPVSGDYTEPQARPIDVNRVGDRGYSSSEDGDSFEFTQSEGSSRWSNASD
uniref:Uncharacterized protein n=1 Tax=Beihai cephalopholis spiloparaea astrovirus TaxID=2116122 RepID=A0A2P1GMC6_9VIRU|nr:hypothetical protein [Beihai cephalopholis spiloparaea astrovirus]